MNSAFIYVPSFSTNISITFDRARAALAPRHPAVPLMICGARP